MSIGIGFEGRVWERVWEIGGPICRLLVFVVIFTLCTLGAQEEHMTSSRAGELEKEVVVAWKGVPLKDAITSLRTNERLDLVVREQDVPQVSIHLHGRFSLGLVLQWLADKGELELVHRTDAFYLSKAVSHTDLIVKGYTMGFLQGVVPEQTTEDLSRQLWSIIKSGIAPHTWKGSAYIRVQTTGSAFMAQTKDVHHKVERFLFQYATELASVRAPLTERQVHDLALGCMIGFLSAETQKQTKEIKGLKVRLAMLEKQVMQLHGRALREGGE